LSALTAFQKVKLYAPTTTIENLKKIEEGLFLKIVHTNPECLSRLPNFGDIINKYTIAYDLYKKRSPNAILDLCQATCQLKEAKEKCTYSLRIQRDFMKFLDTIDFNKDVIVSLYESVFTNNQKFSENIYSEWSTADLVIFFKSYGRMDLLRQLLASKITDGATLHELLSGNSAETKNLVSLLEPLLHQLLEGQIGSIKEAQIDNKKNIPTESPTNNRSTSRSNLKPRVSSKRTKLPNLPPPKGETNSLKTTIDLPSGRSTKRDKSSLISKMRRSSSSSSSSRLTFSDSNESEVKSESPERKDLQEGWKIGNTPCTAPQIPSSLDLENLDEVEIELSLIKPPSQDK